MIKGKKSILNFTDVRTALVAKFGKTTATQFLTRCAISGILDKSFFQEVMFETDWHPTTVLADCKNNSFLAEFV